MAGREKQKSSQERETRTRRSGTAIAGQAYRLTELIRAKCSSLVSSPVVEIPELAYRAFCLSLTRSRRFSVYSL